MRKWRSRCHLLGSGELELDPTSTSVLFPLLPSCLHIDLLLSMGLWLNGLGRAFQRPFISWSCPRQGGLFWIPVTHLIKNPQHPDAHVPLLR